VGLETVIFAITMKDVEKVLAKKHTLVEEALKACIWAQNISPAMDIPGANADGRGYHP
jgi:hypothetical protein